MTVLTRLTVLTGRWPAAQAQLSRRPFPHLSIRSMRSEQHGWERNGGIIENRTLLLCCVLTMFMQRAVAHEHFHQIFIRGEFISVPVDVLEALERD